MPTAKCWRSMRSKRFWNKFRRGLGGCVASALGLVALCRRSAAAAAAETQAQAARRKRRSRGKEDYLSYRELATLALRRTHKAVFGEEPSDKLSAKQLTDELFAYYDKQEEALFAKLFASAEEHLSTGQPQLAVSEFGWILANQPDHPRRVEMALAFRKYGEQVKAEAEQKNDDGLRSQAVGWLRHAVLLSSNQPDIAKLRAQIHLLDGKLALKQGGDGRSDFAAALLEDPSPVRSAHVSSPRRDPAAATHRPAALAVSFVVRKRAVAARAVAPTKCLAEVVFDRPSRLPYDSQVPAREHKTQTEDGR